MNVISLTDRWADGKNELRVGTVLKVLH